MLHTSANSRPSGRALFLGALAAACRPRKRLTVPQWADAHRGILCGIVLGALVWVVGLLIWWWL